MAERRRNRAGIGYGRLQRKPRKIFPTTGGILKTMALQNDKYTYMAVDGVENCKECLKDIESGNVHNCFIEMSACVGSCVGGPVMENTTVPP